MWMRILPDNSFRVEIRNVLKKENLNSARARNDNHFWRVDLLEWRKRAWEFGDLKARVNVNRRPDKCGSRVVGGEQLRWVNVVGVKDAMWKFKLNARVSGFYRNPSPGEISQRGLVGSKAGRERERELREREGAAACCRRIVPRGRRRWSLKGEEKEGEIAAAAS